MKKYFAKIWILGKKYYHGRTEIKRHLTKDKLELYALLLLDKENIICVIIRRLGI